MLRTAAICALFCLFVGCGGSNRATIRNEALSVTVEAAPVSVVIHDAGGRQVLSTLTEGGVGPYGTFAAAIDRPDVFEQLIPGWDGYTSHEDPWVRKRMGRIVQADARSVTVEMAHNEATLTLRVEVEGRRVQIVGTSTDLVEHRPEGPKTRTALSFASSGDEHFFGMGERYATTDHRGHRLYNWSEEVGLGAGEDVSVGPENPYPNGPSMTGFPVPFFMSTAGYGLFLDTTYRSEMFFGSERADAWQIAVDHTEVPLTIYVDEDPLEILEMYTADSGRPIIPAPWVFGPRRRVSPNDMVDGIPEWEALRQRGVPTTGIDDAVHFLPANSHVGRESELAVWVNTLHDNGFKVMAYNTPYVSQSDSRAINEYTEGLENDLFLLTPFGSPGLTWFISGSLHQLASIDLTTAAGVEFFQTLLRRTLEMGYDGWMHDFGEYTQRDWIAGDGRRGDELHNLFPVLSARAAHRLMQEERPNDYLYFVRSGYAGTQRYTPAVWGSDPEATFDPVQGLPSALRAGVNLGMSGVPYYGSDISGFKCLTDDPRDKEMYLRWAQLGAVSPIMMDQNACSNPITGGETKWDLWDDQETIDVYGAMARLHTRLQPYFMVQAREANRSGRPIMTHPFLLHPLEPQAWATDAAFYVGPGLFAAPVVTRGARQKNLWLPPGDYVDLEDYAVYQGGQEVSIPAPLAKLPLLIVRGHIVPMLDPSVETLAPAAVDTVVTVTDVADRLDVVVALAPGDTATMTLVDGTVLTAERRSTDDGPASSLAAVDEASVAACANCYVETAEGDVARLRITSGLSLPSEILSHDVVLRSEGGLPKRVRWDVLRL